MLFTWGEKYRVGIEIVDDQHKKLIALINELHEAMSLGEGSEVMEETLDELVEYTYTHFSSEENLMNIYHYPDLGKHKVEHEYFAKQVSNIKHNLERGSSIAITLSTMNFLKDWLSNHILGTDMQYAPFLKEQGAK